MAAVIEGSLQTQAGADGTSFFIDPVGLAQLSAELAAARDKLNDAEQSVRSAAVTIDDPSAGSIGGLMHTLGFVTDDLVRTTAGLVDRVDQQLPTVPPVPERSPQRDAFPRVPWPLVGFADPTQEGAEQMLAWTRQLTAPGVVGVTTEARVQVQHGQSAPFPPWGTVVPRGLMHGTQTARTLRLEDPMGGDPSAMYQVFSRTGLGVGARARASDDSAVQGDLIPGVYRDVTFFRSPESAALDQGGGQLPDTLDPDLLRPGDSISVIQRGPDQVGNSGERTFEATVGGLGVLGVRYGLREWSGQRVALEKLTDGDQGVELNALDVGTVHGERERVTLVAGLDIGAVTGPWVGASVMGGLQMNVRRETTDGLRFLFGDVSSDAEERALVADNMTRALQADVLLLPPGTRVDHYWRNRFEQTADLEGSAQMGVGPVWSVGAGGLLRGTVTGSSVLTERTRARVVESTDPGAPTAYRDLGTGEDKVTIQHYGVDPALRGEIELEIPIPFAGVAVDFGSLHLGGLRDPFRTIIAKDHVAGDPNTPVRITVEGFGERAEFTERQARVRALQLAADGDPRAANPVMASLAQGRTWQESIGVPSGARGPSDVVDWVQRTSELLNLSPRSIVDAGKMVNEIGPLLPTDPAVMQTYGVELYEAARAMAPGQSHESSIQTFPEFPELSGLGYVSVVDGAVATGSEDLFGFDLGESSMYSGEVFDLDQPFDAGSGNAFFDSVGQDLSLSWDVGADVAGIADIAPVVTFEDSTMWGF